MFVEKSKIGNTIGVKLKKKKKKWSRDKECKYIELKVCNGNVAAINLYKKEGFKDIKTIMSLELGEQYGNLKFHI